MNHARRVAVELFVVKRSQDTISVTQSNDSIQRLVTSCTLL